MPTLNKEQILQRGWTEEIFESLTGNKGQIIKNGENFWHSNSIQKYENSKKFKKLSNKDDVGQKKIVSQTNKDRLTKEEVLERGWSREAFNRFLKTLYIKNKDGEKLWSLINVERFESHPDFNAPYKPKETPNKEEQVIKKKISGNITKEELLTRGWSEDSILHLAGKSHLNKDKEQVWYRSGIEKKEKTVEFKNFTNGKEFKNRNKSLVSGFELTAKAAMNLISSLDIDFTAGNHLLGNVDNYDLLKPIYHLTKTDFAPEENGSYSLFTDGSFKTLNNKSFASCGGWIMDNITKEVVVEFSKPIELDVHETTPNFELIGISEGAKLVNQLGLKNVQCYTDEAEHARRIFCYLNDFEKIENDKNKELYTSINNNLKNSNASFSWIPRESNHHADELSDIPVNAWRKQHEGEYKEKDYIAEHGYKVDREKSIFLHQNNVEIKDNKTLENRHTLTIAMHTEGKQPFMVSLIHDRTDHRLSILEAIHRDYSYIDENLPKDIFHMKRTKADSVIIMHLARAINHCKNLGDINVTVPGIVIAVIKKATPIPSDLQEEFFELHKALSNYPGSLTFTSKNGKLQEKIKEYLQVVEEKIIGDTHVPTKIKPK